MKSLRLGWMELDEGFTQSSVAGSWQHRARSL
jgi:hypothetical protein